MADLESLIKYRKHNVDEKQKILAALYREAEEIEQQQQKIRDQMDHEKALTEELATPDAAVTYNLYAEGARRKIAALQEKLDKLQIRIQAAQEAMREAFADMKKIEITDRNRKDRAKKARDKKDADTLDDVAIDMFRRQKEDD